MADILVDTDPTAAPNAPQALVHVDALPVGTRLAEFEIQGLLGAGGFGLVYRAYDHSLHRTVAIKEYMPASLASRQDGIVVSIRSSADLETYQSGLKSFVAEARLLAQFDHPSLVKVYRFWEANNTAYMVMPLYSGVTLKQARSQMAAAPPEAWLRTVLWSILQALQVLHEHQTMHRDVSPDNIFLQDVGPPVLLDLGAARRAISDKSHKLTAILKVNYAPIEQYAEAEDLKQGPWTDLYALAAVVYSCLRNDPPLPATARVVRDSMPTVRSIVDTLQEHFGLAYSDRFVQALTQALAVQPAERPQSVQDFVATMGLEAPPALGKFDWRASLGSGLLPAVKSEPESGVPEATLPQTVAADTATTVAPRSRWTGWRPRRAWGVALLVVAGLVAGVLVYDGVTGGSPLVAAPEPAVTPAPLSVQAPMPELPASEAASADTPVPGGQGQPAPSAVVSGTAGEANNPAPKAAAKKPAAKPGVKQPVPDHLLCADSSFVMRPVCIYRQCLKPENAKRPICIEERRRNQERPPPPPL
jgi:non-specific serine/threonine protein kinase